MVYLISYFIVNVIFASMMIRNVYFISHPKNKQEEMKEDLNFFLPLTLLFGTILLIMEYYYRSVDGE